MLNLTTTTKRLKIGKIKLYELLEITGIKPVTKGRSKFITDEQFELLQKGSGLQPSQYLLFDN